MLDLTRRKLMFLLAGVSASGSWGDEGRPKAVQTISGGRHTDVLELVNPELREFLRGLPKEPPLTVEMVRQMRVAEASTRPLLPPGVVVQKIPGAKGAPDIQVFIFNGTPGRKPRCGLLYMHGGGFFSGSTQNSFPGFRGLQKIARDHECTVVSVDYRLAPETRFPGSLDDNYAALKWFNSNAKELGVDPTRIAVMGESAGGGHAAALTIAARDRGEIPILFQLLIYPMLDDRTGSTRNVPHHIGAFIWTPESNRFGWSSLLGMPAGSETVLEGAVPGRVSDLRGLPPTYIGVGSLDLFVDEDIAFSRRLIDAGVPTELYVAPGAYHGFFFLVPNAAVSKKFDLSYNDALAKAFASHG